MAATSIQYAPAPPRNGLLGVSRATLAMYYRNQGQASFRSMADRFGNAVDHAALGVKPNENAALQRRPGHRSPCMGTYDYHGDNRGRSDRIGSASQWHLSPTPSTFERSYEKATAYRVQAMPRHSGLS